MNLRYMLKELASAWKDLLLLVLGIYLALWLEGKVQDWQDDNRQKDYFYRLSIDLKQDADQLAHIYQRLEQKLEKLNNGLRVIVSDEFTVSISENQTWVLNTATQVNSYHFFTPQDFTFISMRESGDFKLIQDEDAKNKLLAINKHYPKNLI